jgi:hypothetical protein
MSSIFKKIIYRFFKKYAIYQHNIEGETYYVALYRRSLSVKFKAIDKKIPDIEESLLTSDNLDYLKREIYREDYLWIFRDVNNLESTITDYCIVKTKKEAERLIDNHKEICAFKNKKNKKSKIIEYY